MTQGMANNHQKEAARAQNRSSLRTSRRNPPCRPPDFIHVASRAVGEETALGRPVCDSSPRKLTQAPTLHLMETAFILLQLSS